MLTTGLEHRVLSLTQNKRHLQTVRQYSQGLADQHTILLAHQKEEGAGSSFCHGMS